jgi:hypothetical protein
MTSLDFALRLMDPSLKLDSMDLAEIVAELERQDGWSPMDRRVRPTTWGDFAGLLEAGVPSEEEAGR